MRQLTREFLVSDPVEDAVRKAKITLKNLGELSAVVPGQYVVGHVACGIQHTTLRVCWHAEGISCKLDGSLVHHHAPVATVPTALQGTMLLLEASSEEGGEPALRSAMERFEGAYLHFDRPDYKPDRAGVLPATIIAVVVAVLLLGTLIAMRTGLFQGKPGPNASPSSNAGAAIVRVLPGVTGQV